ncbi:MAG: hypothetical protein HOB37_05840 [Rhodospirillaceae bacterium]|jgi:hypothetical protein|nr:hypothetical protein [Rhodospirillaceae bacterium]MBT3909143.1 hypothetical protein [Rhodospirillaceae bacterium]MBT5297232.1 hypothetical protein [Rhodospirillaceae bacterium]MBT5514407.1 hypothetical protein [Rhodospirillaceae bacterium]MBT6086825.1 hypothetical protein [Rhodospirillaceae bacterium]
MNPYTQITGHNASLDARGAGLTWEMMVSEAAYKAYTAIERLFGSRA